MKNKRGLFQTKHRKSFNLIKLPGFGDCSPKKGKEIDEKLNKKKNEIVESQNNRVIYAN